MLPPQRGEVLRAEVEARGARDAKGGLLAVAHADARLDPRRLDDRDDHRQQLRAREEVGDELLRRKRAAERGRVGRAQGTRGRRGASGA